jgi:hypothetical protein
MKICSQGKKSKLPKNVKNWTISLFLLIFQFRYNFGKMLLHSNPSNLSENLAGCLLINRKYPCEIS